MKYYSEILKKLFNDEAALKEAESKHEESIKAKEKENRELAEQKDALKTAVEQAYCEAVLARAKADDLLETFKERYVADGEKYIIRINTTRNGVRIQKYCPIITNLKE